MGGGDVDVFEDIVFFFHLHADDALAAASLFAEGVDRHALDVVVFGDGDDHMLIGDEVFHVELPFCGDDFRFALGFVVFAELFEFFFDDAADERFAGKDSAVSGRFFAEVLCIRLRFFRAQGR